MEPSVSIIYTDMIQKGTVSISLTDEPHIIYVNENLSEREQLKVIAEGLQQISLRTRQYILTQDQNNAW